MAMLHVGILKVDRNTFSPFENNRLEEFRFTVSFARSYLNDEYKPGLKLLIAPEYFWSEYEELGNFKKKSTAVPLDRRSAKKLFKGLQEISASYNGLIIVAGSVFHQNASGQKHMASNVCPVLLNGEFIHKSYKEMDDGSAERSGYVFDNSPAGDPYFEVGGVGFGLEICMDHLHGRLKNWNEKAMKTVDVQIVVADGSGYNEKSVVARDGGYILSCDIGNNGVAAALKVNHRGIGGLEKMESGNSSLPQVNGARIVFFSLALP